MTKVVAPSSAARFTLRRILRRPKRRMERSLLVRPPSLKIGWVPDTLSCYPSACKRKPPMRAGRHYTLSCANLRRLKPRSLRLAGAAVLNYNEPNLSFLSDDEKNQRIILIPRPCRDRLFRRVFRQRYRQIQKRIPQRFCRRRNGAMRCQSTENKPAFGRNCIGHIPR